MFRLQRHLTKILLAATGLLFFLPLGSRVLWDSDEGRYAEIAREMLELRDWVSPHLNYVLYFEKPPLVYWIIAGFQSVFGLHAFSARLCSGVFGFLTVAVVMVIGRRWKNERVGWIAGAVTATSLIFFALTQFLALDMALTFWTTLSLLAASRILGERQPDIAQRYTWLLAIAGAGGLLTKGPIAIFLPVMAIGLTAWWTRSAAPWTRLSWKSAFLLCVVLAAPWFILVSVRHPFFLKFFFIHEHLDRYLTTSHHRPGPWYYYIAVIAAGFLPWTMFLPTVARSWFRHRAARMKRDPVGALLVIWTIFIFIFFSISHSKLIGYILPLVPALALLMAAEWDDAMAEPTMPAWIGHGVAALIIFFLAGLFVIKGPLEIHPPDDPIVALLVTQSVSLTLILAMNVFILVGVWGMRRAGPCLAGILVTQVIFLLGLVALAPTADAYVSTHDLGETVQERAQPEDKVACYGVSFERSLQTFLFYARRRVLVLGDPGELQMGLDHATDRSDWFVPVLGASDAVGQLPGGSWVVTDDDTWKAMQDGPMADSWTLVQSQGPFRLLQKNI